MRVFNPIYDTIFKFLMEDIEVAHGLISLIIEEEVVELIPAPQESTSFELKLKYNQLPLIRLDYVAIIKTLSEKGEEQYHKVSIEVQKSPFVPEMGRFRKYVSEKYARQSEFKTDKDSVQKAYLPLKTIYFIDKAFNKQLPPVMRRRGDYWDVLEHKKYTGSKDHFVELLNHDSWFIQMEILPTEMKSELLYCLSVFAPWLRDAEDERYINLPENDQGLQKYQLLSKIMNRLYLAGKSREVETALEMEASLEKYIDNLERDKQHAEKERFELLKQKEKERKQKENERRQKEEALQKIIDLARFLKSMNVPVKQIIAKTGLSGDDIDKL